MALKQATGIYAPDGSLYITLTDGVGNLASAGGGSSGITTGTTTITSGTNTRVLFNDSGTVGEDSGLTFTKATDALAVAGSVAIGGATIGSNALAVTGSIIGSTTISLAGAGSLSVPTVGIRDVNSGWYGPSAGALSTTHAGVDGLSVFNTVLRMNSGMSLQWASGSSVATAGDLKLERDAANTLAQRNGTNAQTFNLYNTYTDGSNNEVTAFTWSSNIFTMSLGRGNGTGTNRTAAIQFFGSSGLLIQPLGSTAWQFAQSGHLLAGTDNTYDIGASGATRPRNVFIAGNISAAGGTAGFLSGSVQASVTSYIYWNGSTSFHNRSDGVVTISNFAETDFGRLQFGGTTSSFPALKRSTTALIVRLADDSANAPLEALTVRPTGFTVATLPAAGTAGRIAYVTDQLTTAAAKGVAPTGGGSVVCAVFDNGSSWVGI